VETKEDLNCSREIFHDDSSTDDADGDEDISDEAMDARHTETLRKMRDRWMQLQQLRHERKLLQSSGQSTLKSGTGSGHKQGQGYGQKRKYGGTPRSESGVSKGTYSSRKRGRGRPPKSNHSSSNSQYAHAHANAQSSLNGVQSGDGSAEEDDGDSQALDNENDNEQFGHEEETDSAIDKDEEEEVEEAPEIKRLQTRSVGGLNSPAHSVHSHHSPRRVA